VVTSINQSAVPSTVNWQHRVYKTKTNKTKTIRELATLGIQDEEKQNKNNPENWQHRVYKTKTNKTKTIQRIGNIGYTRRRKTKQKQSRELAT
jgi:hypothetical protein